MQKCESTSYGITAPDVLLEKTPRNMSNLNRKYHLLRNLWPNMYFLNFLKFQFGTFIKNKHLTIISPFR